MDPTWEELRAWTRPLTTRSGRLSPEAFAAAALLLDYINEIRRDPLVPTLTVDELVRRIRLSTAPQVPARERR